MAVRSSMTALIERIRLMTSDVAGSNQVFTDQEVQDMLDRHRSDWRYAELQAAQTVAPGGTVSYKEFYSDEQNWENDASLVDSGYNTLTPTTSDYLVGKWTFTTAPTTPVMITGKTYDLYAAASDLLEAWAAKLALEFDFSAGGQSFQRSQKQAQILNLAKQYKARRRVSITTMLRDDIN